MFVKKFIAVLAAISLLVGTMLCCFMTAAAQTSVNLITGGEWVAGQYLPNSGDFEATGQKESAYRIAYNEKISVTPGMAYQFDVGSSSETLKLIVRGYYQSGFFVAVNPSTIVSGVIVIPSNVVKISVSVYDTRTSSGGSPTSAELLAMVSNGTLNPSITIAAEQPSTTTRTEPTSDKYYPGAIQDGDLVTINGVKYVETFYDDFNGNELDATKWSCPEGIRHGGSNWNKDNVSLDGNGNLLLKADYTSGSDLVQCGAIESKHKFEQTRGYFEIRCKLQSKDGFWSAFWLYPTTRCVSPADSSYSDERYKQPGGEDGTEIDIFEAVNINNPSSTGKRRVFQHALHWDGYSEPLKGSISAEKTPNIYDGKFHTFALDWTENEYVFYVDGKISYRIAAFQIKNRVNGEADSTTCKVPLHMLVSLEASSSWSGLIGKKDVPDYFTVDYVKAYQRLEYLDGQITTSAPESEPSSNVPAIKYGDANGDGDVDLLDLLLMRKHLAKWNVEIDTKAADCNVDGDVNLLDLLLMRKYLAKWNVVLGPQK